MFYAKIIIDYSDSNNQASKTYDQLTKFFDSNDVILSYILCY